MSEAVADFVLSRLRDWGVKQGFGYPGDGINGLPAAWCRAGNEAKFVQARQEEMAASKPSPKPSPPVRSASARQLDD